MQKKKIIITARTNGKKSECVGLQGVWKCWEKPSISEHEWTEIANVKQEPPIGSRNWRRIQKVIDLARIKKLAIFTGNFAEV